MKLTPCQSRLNTIKENENILSSIEDMNLKKVTWIMEKDKSR